MYPYYTILCLSTVYLNIHKESKYKGKLILEYESISSFLETLYLVYKFWKLTVGFESVGHAIILHRAKIYTFTFGKLTVFANSRGVSENI